MWEDPHLFTSFTCTYTTLTKLEQPGEDLFEDWHFFTNLRELSHSILFHLQVSIYLWVYHSLDTEQLANHLVD